MSLFKRFVKAFLTYVFFLKKGARYKIRQNPFLLTRWFERFGSTSTYVLICACSMKAYIYIPVWSLHIWLCSSACLTMWLCHCITFSDYVHMCVSLCTSYSLINCVPLLPYIQLCDYLSLFVLLIVPLCLCNPNFLPFWLCMYVCFYVSPSLFL